jgi:hypothetical protein
MEVRTELRKQLAMFSVIGLITCHCALVLETNDPARTKGVRNTTINHNVNTRRERAVEQDPSGGAPRLVGGRDEPRPPMQ